MTGLRLSSGRLLLRIASMIFATLPAGCMLFDTTEHEEQPIPPLDADGGYITDPAARADAARGVYRVQRGDTLYAIAFKHGVDYRDLAAWNHIEPPYRILIGQELSLKPAQKNGGTTGGAVTSAAPDTAVAASVSALSAGPKSSNVENRAPAAKTPPPLAARPPEPAAPQPAPPKQVVAEPPKAPDGAPQLNAGGVNWRWPADGNVVGTYVAGDQIRQGIDIAGKEGDAVLATADGEVVYSGNGLLGYGELVIIKHNASFLSAYGHNRKRLVQEGERVKAGQRIAEMGASAAARDELHFEIRKNGKPVNPLDYLPVR